MLIKYKWDDPILRSVWKKLYKDNPYLFPYSSFEYNEQVFAYTKIKPTTLFQKNYFFVYYEHEQPIMVMPLFEKKNRVYLFGENISGAGNLDFVYTPSVRDEQFFAALAELKKQLPGRELRLYKINERSKLYYFLKKNDAVLTREYSMQMEEDRICIKVVFPDSFEDYFKNLGRNTKSNMHKAYNKVVKTEADMRLQVIHGPLEDKELLSALMKIYTKRDLERKHKSYNVFAYMKHRHFSALTWAMEHLESHYTFCLFLKGQPAAFMTGFLTNFKEIVFPIVAMNSEFSKYAPGKLMICESIKYLQRDCIIRGLDLSRGDERYKLEMGGTSHFNYRFFLKL